MDTIVLNQRRARCSWRAQKPLISGPNEQQRTYEAIIWIRCHCGIHRKRWNINHYPWFIYVVESPERIEWIKYEWKWKWKKKKQTKLICICSRWALGQFLSIVCWHAVVRVDCNDEKHVLFSDNVHRTVNTVRDESYKSVGGRSIGQ